LGWTIGKAFSSLGMNEPILHLFGSPNPLYVPHLNRISHRIVTVSHGSPNHRVFLTRWDLVFTSILICDLETFVRTWRLNGDTICKIVHHGKFFFRCVQYCSCLEWQIWLGYHEKQTLKRSQFSCCFLPRPFILSCLKEFSTWCLSVWIVQPSLASTVNFLLKMNKTSGFILWY
jgi:hypothetical protein